MSGLPFHYFTVNLCIICEIPILLKLYSIWILRLIFNILLIINIYLGINYSLGTVPGQNADSKILAFQINVTRIMDGLIPSNFF